MQYANVYSGCTAKKKECELAVLKTVKYTKKKNLVYRRFKRGDNHYIWYKNSQLGWCSKFFTLCDQVVANSRERVCFANKFWLPVLVHQTHNLSCIKFNHISRPVETVEGSCISWSSLEAHRMKPSMLRQMQRWIRMKNNRSYHWLQCTCSQ